METPRRPPGLRSCTPEEVGVPSAALHALVDALDDHDETHSVVVARHGAVVAEGWWDPYRPELAHDLYSLAKTVTGLAVGLARQDGLLGLDDPVVSFFPDEVPADPDPRLASMRVRDLLTMRTGHHQDTSRRVLDAPDPVRAFLALPVEHEPGTWFAYDTGASYMLSAIVTRVTGQRLLDHLRPRLLDPLGIAHGTWEQCPRGVDVGGFGLALRTRDVAALGVLLAADGVHDGVRLLPAGWVAEATADPGPCAPGPDPHGPPEWQQGYGYHLWRSRHGFRADGGFGQLCVVVPEVGLVVAVTAGDSDTQGVLDRVWDLLPHLADAPLPPDPDGRARLARRLAGLVHPAPAARQGDGVPRLADRDLAVLPGVGDLHRLRIGPGAHEDVVHVRTRAADLRLRAGHGTWVEQTLRLPSVHGGPAQDRLSLVCADRPGPGAYRLTLRSVTTPFRWTAVLREEPDGTGVLTVDQNVGHGPTSWQARVHPMA